MAAGIANADDPQVSTVVERARLLVPQGVLVPGVVQDVDVVGVDLVAFEHDVVLHFDDGGTTGVADVQFAPHFGDVDSQGVGATFPFDRDRSDVLIRGHVAALRGSSTTDASASR